MMSFVQFLTESDHAHGTKVFAYPDEDSKAALYDWVKANNVPEPMHPDQYHVTVIYSDHPCPDVKDYDFHLPVKGRIIGWKVFTSPLGKCLVAHIESPELVRINADLKTQYGATSKFPTYVAHITVTWKWDGDEPNTFPPLDITFDRVKISGVDPNWKPK